MNVPDEKRERKKPTPLFREQAVEHHRAGVGAEGKPLEISGSWTRWTFWVLIALTAAAIAFAIFARIPEYARGVAIVDAEGRVEAATRSGGVVASVHVVAGEAVSAGDLLVEFDATDERAEFDRAQLEFDLALLRRLRDPGDSEVARSLSALRARRQLASERLEARQVRSPAAGVVSDVRVRPGQLLEAGRPAVTVATEGRSLRVVAMFPGHFGPRLEEGQAALFQLDGYRSLDLELTLDHVSREVIGPDDAKRFLGTVGEALPLDGSIVMAHAKLPSTEFEVDGETFLYRDGMQGRLEAKLRDESILATILPKLKDLFR